MKNLLFLLISLVAFSMQIDAKSSLTRLQAWTILQDSLKLNEKGYSFVCDTVLTSKLTLKK